MKRWMRPILAILMGVLAICYVGMVPAQAAERGAKTETVITYRGYTLSWSESDGSDLRIARTPGRSERLPDAVIKRSIQQAKSKVARAAQQQLSEDATDSCNFVPDTFGLANFTKACDAHDACYSSDTDRLDCDIALLEGLTKACAKAYPHSSQLSLRLTCFTVAGIYFVGVRLFGAWFYTGGASEL